MSQIEIPDWVVERHFNRMSFVTHFTVVKWDRNRPEYLLNKRGRVKRFRSEERAKAALKTIKEQP